MSGCFAALAWHEHYQKGGAFQDAVIYAKQAICVFNQPNIPPKSRDTHSIIEYECAKFEETLASRFLTAGKLNRFACGHWCVAMCPVGPLMFVLVRLQDRSLHRYTAPTHPLRDGKSPSQLDRAVLPHDLRCQAMCQADSGSLFLFCGASSPDCGYRMPVLRSDGFTLRSTCVRRLGRPCGLCQLHTT